MKTFRAALFSKASLAAPSRRRRSFFPRVPLAVPHWNGSTYGAIINALVSNAVIDGAALEGLRSLLIHRFGIEDAMLCGSGSVALEMALRACGVRQGDEVVIPTFCCGAVVSPIVAVGAVPVLADVGNELNLTAETVLPVLTRKIKVIVVPHLFGNPAEIEAIVDLAREKNIRVIDDAAQAFGATIDGRLAGSFGDIGILSFGAEKVCFGLGGGALLSRRGDFLSDAASLNLKRPRLAPTLRTFLSTLFWHRWRRWTLPLHEWSSRADSIGPETKPKRYRSESMPNLNAGVALSLVRSLDENLEARRVRALAYRELLGDTQGLELISHRPGSAYLTQVVRVARKGRNEDRAIAAIEALRRAGYEVQGSYVPLHHLPHCSMCVWENLSYADRVWPDLIELPCEPSVSIEDIEQIATIIKTIIQSEPARAPTGCRA
jgi:Predicted pyridoxal phosphate-dependent enzyme apparently involved in regulation of cell wall biogenesis